jgi:dipeptidyl aminopeptidase/acylaminoacyl peptidase
MEQTDDGRYLSLLTVEPVKTVYAGSDGSEWGLLRLELETGDTLRLVEPSTDRIRTAWSPDGTRWAWTDEGDVHLRSVEGDSAVNLTEGLRETEDDGEEDEGGAEDAPAGVSGSPEDEEGDELRFAFERWRPDGAAVLVSSDGPEGEAWHLLELGSGELRQVFAPEADEEERPRRRIEGWSPDGRWLYLSTSERDRWERGLARLDVSEGGDGELETLVSDRNLYRGWRLAEDGSRLIFEMSDGDRPDELYVADPAFRSTTRLTDLNPWLQDRTLARTELVEYLDADGETRYGILYLPADREEGDEPRPLVVEVYEDFFDNGFHTTMNVMTAQGWIGFRPSVDFEEGYPGEAWLKGVTAGVNELVERGLVDGERVGIHGTSYGGYATNLLITQTDRFAAAINISGKVNIISFLGDSPKITTRNYRAAERGQDRIGATLWEQPQKYVAHSAVMFADRIETPLLLLSGEGDWNVPHTNQREMYYALRRLGKEVVWVHYMTGGHGAGWASTPADYVDQYRRMVAWYAEHFADAAETGAEGEEGVAGGR